MTEEQFALLKEVAANQRHLTTTLDHALAGPPGDKGPRKGWLRELIAELQSLSHPRIVFPGEIKGSE